MITYHILPAHEIKDYLVGNEERHYNDIKDKSLYKTVSVNYEIYEELSQEGLCYATIAKDGDKIIGYNIYMLTADLNDNSEVMATEVAMFIEEEYRGVFVIDFIKQCDKLLKTKEVKRVLRSYTDERIGRILDIAGYTPRSIIKSKTL